MRDRFHSTLNKSAIPISFGKASPTDNYASRTTNYYSQNQPIAMGDRAVFGIAKGISHFQSRTANFSKQKKERTVSC
jgi:hypothetical protein